MSYGTKHTGDAHKGKTYRPEDDLKGESITDMLTPSFIQSNYLH